MKLGRTNLLCVFRVSALPEHKLLSMCVIDVFNYFLLRLTFSHFCAARSYKIKKTKKGRQVHIYLQVTL
jgi:hypothetical protein